LADWQSLGRRASEGNSGTGMAGAREKLRELYLGSTRAAQTFQVASLLLELILMIYFVASSFLPHDGWLIAIDLLIAAILLADFAARWWIAPTPAIYFRRLSTWADMLVLLTLVLPAFSANLLFLRALRAVRIFRSYHILRDLNEEYTFIRKNRDAIEASINLLVFIFVMSAIVYVLEVRRHPEINHFVDALYYTVSTLTTTGFGDINFKDVPGRLLSIFIMIVGVSLFLRLIQVVFRPTKVRYTCPTCGLLRHDPDAVHCKHCGQILKIENEGLD
jgi:voltage-gated potassium channel